MDAGGCGVGASGHSLQMAKVGSYRAPVTSRYPSQRRATRLGGKPRDQPRIAAAGRMRTWLVGSGAVIRIRNGPLHTGMRNNDSFMFES